MATIEYDFSQLPHTLSILKIGSRVMQRRQLMDLPAELRNQIWEDVVIEPDIHNRRHHSKCPLIDHDATFARLPMFVEEPRRRPWEPIEEELKTNKCRSLCRARQGLGLLRVNKQVASEATPIFWQNASFHFIDFPELGHILKYRIPEASYSLIRGIVVHSGESWPARWWRASFPRSHNTDFEAQRELKSALQYLPNLSRLTICPYNLLKLEQWDLTAFLGRSQPDVVDLLLRTGTLTLLTLLEIPLLDDRSAKNPYACINRIHTLTSHGPRRGESDSAWRERLETPIFRDAQDMAGWDSSRNPVRKAFLEHLEEAVRNDTAHKAVERWTHLGKSYAEHVRFLGILPKRKGNADLAEQQKSARSRPGVTLTDPEDQILNQNTARQTRIQSQPTRFDNNAIDHQAILEQRRIRNLIADKSEKKSRKKAVRKSMREQEAEKKACRKRCGRRS